jgi:hypothetical protein
MNKKIIVSVTNDLSCDQRVDKVCNSLGDMGFDVLLVGRKQKQSPSLSDRKYKIYRFSLLFNKGMLFYAEFNIRLFFLLLFSKVDILLSNDTDTLLANFLASKIRRKKLVFDAHELFPELPELAYRPKTKRIWEKIEDWIFPHLKYC